MKKLRLTAMALMALMSVTTMAQNDNVEDWMQNLRPEHCEEQPAGGGAVQRGVRRIGSQTTAPLKSHGVKRVPVVLVAFADKAFTVASTDAEVNEFYQKFCNGTMDGQRYTGHGSHGSIRDYFVEQSDSDFLPEFTVIGPVTLDKGYASYGGNSGKTKDVGYSAFRNEAIQKAMTLYSEWENFDNDGNGSVDMVFFIFAGLGESNGGDEDCIWPKESTASVTINDRKFATSAVTCESRRMRDADGNYVLVPDGVGVFCHELSHALGLPDFYDTNYVAFGMDLWSVMDYGEYGNNGYNPSAYTAYERDFMGWRPLQELTEPQVLTLACFTDGGYGYKIVNDANSNEYYIIENRQPRGWDDVVCAQTRHGLMVTHVDFDQSRWNGNSVNTDPNHQRMTIIAANNKYDGTNNPEKSAKIWQETISGNLYPSNTYNYNLTDESTPAAEVYAGGLLHKPLRNITENEDGTVTVCFMTNGKLEVPVVGEPENIEMDQFDALWGAVDHATQYAVELYRDEALLQSTTLAETTIHFADLAPSSKLKFRVKAMADMPEDYIESDWSNFVYLETLADLITSVPESEKLVDVYTTDGMRVSRCYGDELSRLSLRRGVYLIRYANGAVRKVMLR